MPDDWDREFVLLLRIRGIDGAGIDEALAEVEARCAISGYTPREAFGDPVGYASNLRVLSPRSAPWSKTVILPVLGLVVGVNLALAALLKWSDGVAVTFGLIASIVVFVAFVAMLIAWLTTVLRSRTAYLAWFGAAFALMVAPPLLFRQQLITVHPLIALSLGLLFLGLGLLAVRQIPVPIVGTLET
jgi:multidrug transporter EmrE-like cation transporter